MAEEPTTPVDDPAANPPTDDLAGLKASVEAARQDATDERQKAGRLRTETDKALGDLRLELDKAKLELDASKAGVTDDELQELVKKSAGTQLETASATIDTITAERDDYRSKYDAMVLHLGARSTLAESGVREIALGDALDKVGRFYETKEGALSMRDLDGLGVDESVKKQLLTAKGSPVDLEAFASGYLRENYPHYFPAIGGSGSASAEPGVKVNGSGPKDMTQKQTADMPQDKFNKWREDGGKFLD